MPPASTEVVDRLAVALLRTQGNAAEAWAKKQREVLKTKPGGISRLIRSAAQQKRRRGLTGTKADYDSSINFDFSANRERKQGKISFWKTNAL